MAKKLRVLILPFLILAAMTLSACNPVKTDTIAINTDKAFKTAYVVGEDFDATGLTLVVTYTDETQESFLYTDIRQDVSLTGFSTAQAGRFTATIYFRNKTVDFAYTVSKEANSDIRFQVTFQSNGGTEVESQEIPLYGSVSVPASPTMEGYQFDGWFKESTLINTWDFATEKITEDVTLYAKWAKLYTVTFSAAQSGDPDIIRRVKAGGALTDVPQVPEIPGMNGKWDRNSFSNIRSDVTVLAIYTQRTFHVGFYDTDENKNPVTLLAFNEVPYGTELFNEEPYKSQIEAMREPANALHKHFVGWSENENLRVTEAIYIYARYEADEHTVTYYANVEDGETPYKTQQAAYGTPVAKPTDPVRDGYGFGGWFKEPDCRREWVFRTERVLTDIELYAKWIPLYVLEFYADDEKITELVVWEGATLTMDQIPEVPAKVGCDGAWNRNDFIDIRRNDRIDAVYTASTYTVEFRANGETLTVDGEMRQTVEYGNAATVPAAVPSVRGRSFAGWDKDESAYTYVTSDLIVNAIYTPNYYRVTYWSRLENGAIMEPISVQFGSPLAEPTAPQREKYVFEGWYREDTFVTRWDFGMDVVEEDLTLYAHYITVYYIDFYDFDGVCLKHMEVRETTMVNANEIPTPPDVPGKRVVWFDDSTGRELDLTGPVNEDHTFRPRETGEREYQITYTVNGEEAATLKASYGEAVPVPDPKDLQIPTGMEFISWKPNPEGMTVTDDIVFEAELKRQTYTVRFVADGYETNPDDPKNVFSEVTVQHGGVAYQPTENPERWEQCKEGHQFIGWSETSTNVVRNMVIVARYRKKVFTVSFLDRETNETYYSYEVEYMEKQAVYPADREKPSKRGYTFTGWSEGYNEYVRSDLIIYAEFERTVYVITFESEGGSEVETLRLPYQTVVRRPADPVYAGKAFLGWFTDLNKSVKYVFDRPVDENATLYAGWADYVEGSEGVAYSLNAARTGYEAVYSDGAYEKSHIVIQNYIDELPVVGIGYGAFRNFVNLRSIFIPDTVEYVSPNAFKGCTDLVATVEDGNEFTLPTGVKQIGANAFEDAKSLETVLFADHAQLETIGEFAFADCNSLKEIILPEGVKEIGRGAFFDCRSLRTAVIPESLELMRTEAFARNPKLKYVSFRKAVPPNLETGAFASAPASFHIYVPNLEEYRNVNVSAGWKEVSSRLYSSYYLTRDGNWAYSRIGTGGGRTMNLVQYLGTDIFVTIPQTLQDTSGSDLTVASVGAYAFDSGVEGVTFCSDVALDENTFGGATNLKYLGLIFQSDLHSDLSTVLRRAYNELPLLNTLGITGNASGAVELVTLRVLFGNSAPPAGLEKVRVLEGGDNVIIERMFENCNTLKEVEIASNVVKIGANAFHGAAALERITFLTNGDGTYALTEIGANAFDGCVSLADPAVPDTVRIVGQNAFRRTRWWMDLQAEEGRDGDYIIVGDGILYGYLGTDGSVLYMPDEIKSVGAYAFYNNTKIRGVVFGEDSQLEIIRESAFESAVNLEYVVLPASLSTVEKRVFYNAEKLMKILVFGNRTVQFGAQSIEGTAKGGKLHVYAGHDEVQLSPNVEVCRYRLEFYSDSPRMVDWVVTRGTSGGLEAVQYIGQSTQVEVPTYVSSIHNYAFHRKVNFISLPVTAKLSENSFGGVTELSELSLLPTGTPNYNSVEFNALFKANPGLHAIRVGGQLNLASLLGDTHDSLTKVTVAEGTTSLYRGMFRGFTNLKTIEYEDLSAITEIGANAFDDTAWISERGKESDFVIVNGILVAYLGADRVVTLPEEVLSVNDAVFGGNEMLGLLIMDHKMKIEANAFAGADNLNIIWIKEGAVPDTVGNNAFRCGAEGKILYVPAGSRAAAEAWWSGDISEAPLLYASCDGENDIALVTLTGTDTNGNKTARLVRYLKEDGSVSLDRTEMETEEGTVTLAEIGNNALLRDTVSLVLPLVGLNLQPYALHNLTELKELVLLGTETGTLDGNTSAYLFEKNKGLNTVEYLGDQKLATVLSGAQSSVRTVRISEGATHVVDFALEGFGGVENVVIPESVLDAGTYALEETAWYQNGNSFVVFPSGYLYKYRGSLLRNPSVPADVKTVGKYAFSRYQKSTGTWTGDSAIEEIQFNAGSTARTILPYAFYGLSSLRYVDIPDSMWEIDPSAFEGTQIQTDMEGILAVRGRYSATTIVRYTGTATELTVSASVNKIASGAFGGNETLQKVTFADTSYNKVTLCDRAFENCVNLETVVWHTKMTEIGGWVFAGTAWLQKEKDNSSTSFVVRNSVLLAYAGSDTACTVPNYVEVITADALPATVEVVTILRDLPPSIADGALDRVETVYVPAETLDRYRAQYPKYQGKFAAIAE